VVEPAIVAAVAIAALLERRSSSEITSVFICASFKAASAVSSLRHRPFLPTQHVRPGRGPRDQSFVSGGGCIRCRPRSYSLISLRPTFQAYTPLGLAPYLPSPPATTDWTQPASASPTAKIRAILRPRGLIPRPVRMPSVERRVAAHYFRTLCLGRSIPRGARRDWDYPPAQLWA
jgi:hypothetical protein